MQGEKEESGKQSFPRLSPPGGFSFCRNRSFAHICDNFHQVFDPHRIPFFYLNSSLSHRLLLFC